MEKRKPEREATLENVLRLFNELGPEDQDRVAKELKLQSLRRELEKAEDQVARGKPFRLTMCLHNCDSGQKSG